jgi:hypothetical protein
MPKREVDESADTGHQAYLKRQKIHHVSIASIAEEIHSPQQLAQLLTFEQDAGKASHGICLFVDAAKTILMRYFRHSILQSIP